MRISKAYAKTFLLLAALVCTQALMASAADFQLKILRFEGQQIGDKAKLVWLTESEFNNDYFKVQRSMNGMSWIDIGIVESAGTVPGNNIYEFFDENPVAGEIHYRLMYVDFNGAISLSEEIIVDIEFFIEAPSDPTELFSDDADVFPNPSDDNEVTIELGYINDDTVVEMMDLSGKKMSINTEFNGNQIIVSTTKQLTGLYFLIVTDGARSIVKQVKFR